MKAKNTEYTLESATEKQKLEQIERAIKTIEESTKHLLQQNKFKKFNTLKHKPQTSHRDKRKKKMKRDDQLEPMVTHYFKAQEGDHHHQKINKKLEEINLQMLLVKTQPQTIYQMKSQHQLIKNFNFRTRTSENKYVLNHQQEATPRLTTLKTNE